MTFSCKVPEQNEVWLHVQSQKSYVIVGLGISTASGNVQVYYVTNDKHQMLFNRDLGNFLGSSDDHKPRFRHLPDGYNNAHIQIGDS